MQYRAHRREVIALLAGAAATRPLGAWGQQPSMPTIGWLDFETPDAARESIPAFRKGLAEMGYVEGRNVAIAYRWAEGRKERLSALAAELVNQRVAAIIAVTTSSALAAKAATRTIPVIFRIGSDPVELGLVASLNRPGGNLTGMANLSAEIAAKRLGLLRELVAAGSLIAMMVNPGNPDFARAETRDLESAARRAGVRLVILERSTESELPEAFATLVAQQVAALLISADTFFFAARDRIIALAARHSVPTMFFDRASVAAGGLLSYGPNLVDANHQIGLYAGRVLKGDKPSDLPVVQSAKFQLVINLRTAKSLGLTLPPTLLAIADEAIE